MGTAVHADDKGDEGEGSVAGTWPHRTSLSRPRAAASCTGKGTPLAVDAAAAPSAEEVALEPPAAAAADDTMVAASRDSGWMSDRRRLNSGAPPPLLLLLASSVMPGRQTAAAPRMAAMSHREPSRQGSEAMSPRPMLLLRLLHCVLAAA